MSDKLSNYTKMATLAAKQAGDHLATMRERIVLSSEGRDIKMAADKEAESIIIKALSQSGLPVLSEETPANGKLPTGRYWIIDPLDGTYNFSKGLDDLCCTSIALWDDKGPAIGVVNRFSVGELFVGERDRGAMLNGERITTSGVEKVSEASCATGFSVKGDMSESGILENIRHFRMFKKIRMLGAAALMSAFVGAGRIDVYFERDILLWDVAAGAAIAAAGGAIVNYILKDNYQCDMFCFANCNLYNGYTYSRIS